MKKTTLKKVREMKQKQKEKKWVRKTTIMIAKWVACKLIDVKHARVDFVSPWSITKASDHFHNNFQARLKAHPLGYRGDNFNNNGSKKG